MGRGDLVPRIITDFGVTVRPAAGEGAVPAAPVNLSETGVCVRLRRELAVGESVQLSIQLERGSDGMEVTGRVVWQREDEHNKVWYCGIGFAELTGQQRDRIVQYVREGAEALLAFLAEFPLFEAFTEENCRSLLRIVTLRQLERGEVLYQEGTRDLDVQGLFVVQSGLMRIFKGRRATPDRQLAVVSAGEIFGETTLVTDQAHSATVMAVNDSTLIQINKLGLRLLRQKDPDTALKIMEVVARVLASRLGRTTHMLFSPVRV